MNEKLMQRRAAVRFAKYTAKPIGHIENLMSTPGTFRNMLRIEPVIFIKHIVFPLFEDIELPRGYLINSDYSAYGAVQRMRPSQIDRVDRVLRFILRLRGVPVSVLSFLYDQHPSTVYRDCIHIATLFNDILQKREIKPIPLGTPEYFAKRGQRSFRHFDMALYAVDAIKVKKYKPWNINHGEYRDGHKDEYNFGFLCAADFDGIIRVAHGHHPGSCNDIELYYNSDFYVNRSTLLGSNDKLLADGIFARVEGGQGPFIVPVCYMGRDLTLEESRYNKLQAWDRSIVEHSFGRMKGLCPILEYFTFRERHINIVFISCVILNNIVIRYQHPLRRY